ncbi:unnamed protein product, partial [Cyprideis torosa]
RKRGRQPLVNYPVEWEKVPDKVQELFRTIPYSNPRFREAFESCKFPGTPSALHCWIKRTGGGGSSVIVGNDNETMMDNKQENNPKIEKKMAPKIKSCKLPGTPGAFYMWVRKDIGIITKREFVDYCEDEASDDEKENPQDTADYGDIRSVPFSGELVRCEKWQRNVSSALSAISESCLWRSKYTAIRQGHIGELGRAYFSCSLKTCFSRVMTIFYERRMDVVINCLDSHPPVPRKRRKFATYPKVPESCLKEESI